MISVMTAVKAVGGLAISIGTNTVVREVVQKTAPAGMHIAKKVCVSVATFFVGSAIASAGKDQMKSMVDELTKLVSRKKEEAPEEIHEVKVEA